MSDKPVIPATGGTSLDLEARGTKSFESYTPPPIVDISHGLTSWEDEVAAAGRRMRAREREKRPHTHKWKRHESTQIGPDGKPSEAWEWCKCGEWRTIGEGDKKPEHLHHWIQASRDGLWWKECLNCDAKTQPRGNEKK